MKHNKKVIHQLKRDRDLLVAFLFICIVSVIGYQYKNREFLSPCPKQGCHVETVMAKEPTTELQDVVSETARVFGPEGKGVVREAFNILYCEHGFQKGTKPHKNDNGSFDWGAFQVNSVWDKVFGTKFHTDYKENIRVAHEIWKRSHSFDAWVCAKYL